MFKVDPWRSPCLPDLLYLHGRCKNFFGHISVVLKEHIYTYFIPLKYSMLQILQ